MQLRLRLRLRRLIRFLRSDRGSAIAEWTMIAALLTMVFLTVLQIGFAAYVRNVAIDAAAEGARYASLVGSTLADGEQRTQDLLATALSPGYANAVTASETVHLGVPAIEVTVSAPLPLIGLLGLPETMEVTAYAPVETLDFEAP